MVPPVVGGEACFYGWFSPQSVGLALTEGHFLRASPPTVRDTPVASPPVGPVRDFSDHLSGASLYAVDVFGSTFSGGSAANVARALDWLADHNIAVANISLAGPSNLLHEPTVKAFLAGTACAVRSPGLTHFEVAPHDPGNLHASSAPGRTGLGDV